MFNPAVVAICLVLSCPGFLVPACVAASDRPVESLSSRYIALAIQGDLRPARVLLAESETSQAQDLLAQYDARFTGNSHAVDPSTGNPFADSVVRAYRAYWAANLLRVGNGREWEHTLQEAIAEALLAAGHSAGKGPGQSPVDAMGAVFSNSGFHYLESPSPPFRDLYLWKKQASRDYSVRLTDQTLNLSVMFMEDFVSLGWKEYASLGLATTTGWVENGRLYCVAWAYDTNSENFRVSYLKHEARHLADLTRYPEMNTTELEYRAKLTELAFAHNSLRRILDDFTSKAADNPSSPHAMANYRIVHDMHELLFGLPFAGTIDAWRLASTAQVNQAARSLLTDNTERQTRADH